MLRYGDGTPFPFDDAFLDLLIDAVEACATMLAATANLDQRRAEADAMLQAIGEEERRLVLFERAVAAACAPAAHEQPTPADRAAERTRAAMLSAVERSREQLRQLSEIKAAAPGWQRTARRVHAAAGRFFARRLLHGTRWAWAWSADGPVPRAEAVARDARFQVVFDLELPPAWRAPVRIDSLAPELIARLPRHRWLRKPVEDAVPLGRCLLTAARHDERGRELVIRRPDGAGWQIELPDRGQASAAAIDRRGRTIGSALVSDTELAPLIAAIDRELATHQLQRHAREVMLDGAKLTELADTTLAARTLLGELGPTVRAIRQRSRVPGELSLKRDVADGVREEIYISRASLTARYANLPAQYRQHLDDAGFGRGIETAAAEALQQAPRRTSQPAVAAQPAAAAAPQPPIIVERSGPVTAPERRSPPPLARPSATGTVAPPLAAEVDPRPSIRATHRLFPAPPIHRAPPAVRRRDEPTVPVLTATPPRRAAVEIAAELSEVVTSPLLPRIAPRRLLTPT